jgi:hypothetical protein
MAGRCTLSGALAMEGGGKRPSISSSIGADLHWVGHNGLTPIDAAKRSHAEDLTEWLRNLGAITSAKTKTNLAADEQR